MNDFNPSYSKTASVGAAYNEGLRSFMLGVYTKLALGIGLAGVLAFIAGTVPPVTALIFGTPLKFVVQFGPLALILIASFAMRRPSPLGSAVMYWSIVSLMGLGLGMWVYAATGDVDLASRGGRVMSPEMLTIAKAFLITSTAFAALSLWGYTTKRDLGPIGGFLIMGLFGIVALGLVSLLFPASAMMEYIIMGGVLLLSAGLIAWETQQLKEGYLQHAGDQRSLAVMTNWGALNFFISFVNMFRIILALLSED